MGGPGGPFWGLGGLQREPRRVIGAPWEVPGELRGGPWGTPVGSLGRPWAVLGAIGAKRPKKIARFDVNHGFGPKKGAKWDAQGTHFGSQNRYKIVLKIECDSVSDFRGSWAPSKVKKLYFHWRVVQNRRSAFLPPSAPEVDFGSHFGSPKGFKIIKKTGSKLKENLEAGKVTQRGAKSGHNEP